MKQDKKKWIDEGYAIFALSGETALKIEQLAKRVGISKSSFYHHFADIDGFIEELLKVHLLNAKVMAEKERQATCIDPELISILVAHKTDLLFNRQLRIHSSRPTYLSTLKKSNDVIGTDFVKLWLSDTKLNITLQQAEAIFTLALENFFLQINEANLNHQWLTQYFEELKRITKQVENPIVR